MTKTMNFLRQLDILDPNMVAFPVALIGCGGIGSPTALALAKMGIGRITLIDPDSVEEHNLPNQLFRLFDTGQKKVFAAKDMLADFSPSDVTAVPDRFEGQTPLSGIVISGVDSMKSRQMIWDSVKWNLDVPLYIDGRIGGEIIQILTVRPSQIEDIEFYEDPDNLFPDSEAAELPCTRRGIIYTGFASAALICSQLKKWIKSEKYPRKISFDLKTLTTALQ